MISPAPGPLGRLTPPEAEPGDRPASELAATPGVDVLAVPVHPDDGDGLLLGPGADSVATALGIDLLAVAESGRATGEVGDLVALPVPDGVAGNPALREVCLVGVGRGRPADLRRAAATLARHVRGRAAVATTLAALEDALEPVVTGAVLGSFGFLMREPTPDRTPVARVVLCGLPDDARPALDRARALARAGWRSRTLASVPANVKTPAWLAEQAREVAAEAGLDYRVWDEKQLADEGFGGILAVGSAAAAPPRLVRLDYTPPKSRRRTPTVVLVGKGITFDSGGLSLKPHEAMVPMKRDMTGGGVVISVMAALADVGCPVKVVGLVPSAENAVGAASMRPGDVLRHYGGRTTEVTNTDAEGRLVMGDAMAYAVSEVKPDVMVDVATLTGSIKVALGQQVGGLFATDDALADALLGAGEVAGEPLWRFPIYAGYADKIASKIADADNGARGPLAILAALFLKEFTGSVPWAHLDLASVGEAPDEAHEWTKGPTGFGARALLTWLGSPDPLEGVAR